MRRFCTSKNLPLPCKGEPCLGKTTVPCLGKTTVPCLGETTIPCLRKTTIPCLGKTTIPCLGKTTIPCLGKTTIPCLRKTTIPCLGIGRLSLETFVDLFPHVQTGKTTPAVREAGVSRTHPLNPSIR